MAMEHYRAAQLAWVGKIGGKVAECVQVARYCARAARRLARKGGDNGQGYFWAMARLKMDHARTWKAAQVEQEEELRRHK